MSFQPPTLRPRRRAALAGLLTVVLLAGACGGDDDDEASPEATTSTDAAEVTTTTAAPAEATTTTAAPAATTTTGAPATTTTTTTTGAATGAILVQGFTFTPASLAVKAGTAVTWTNKDQIQHTATSGTSVADGSGVYTGTADGMFDGDMPQQGKTFSFTFSTAGTYKYFCSRHNNMVGEVVVS